MKAVLRSYYEAYPALKNLSEVRAELTGSYGEAGVGEAVNRALQAGYLSQDGGFYEVSPKGMTWLAQRSQGTTNAQLMDLDKKLLELTAKLAEVRNTSEADFKLVAAQTEQRLLQMEQEQRAELKDVMASQQRSFYTTLIPIFTLFVAVIAIVVTVAQTGSKLVVDGDPWMSAAQTLAVVGTSAGMVLALVLVVWAVLSLTTRRSKG